MEWNDLLTDGYGRLPDAVKEVPQKPSRRRLRLATPP